MGLNEVPDVIIFNVTKHPKVPGVSVVDYKIPTLDPKLKTTGALVSVDPKTVYDPSIWTDAKLERALKEAIQDAANKSSGVIDREWVGVQAKVIQYADILTTVKSHLSFFNEIQDYKKSKVYKCHESWDRT
ncbi:MAG TPA: hypothetical protein VIM65_14475 [Cyclobacteriaceae bacterium]